MNTVKITLWEMQSDPGYTLSQGYRRAALVTESIQGKTESDLYYLAKSGKQVQLHDLANVVPFSKRVGMCLYEGYSGEVEVPSSQTLVAYSLIDISTDASLIKEAEVMGI